MPRVFLDALPNPVNPPMFVAVPDSISNAPPMKPTIDISAMSTSMTMTTLGANPTTGIAPTTGLDPAICMIHVSNQSLEVQGASSVSTYYINSVTTTGTQLRWLKHGDMISLKSLTGYLYYSYRVRIEGMQADMSSNLQVQKVSLQQEHQGAPPAVPAHAAASSASSSLANCTSAGTHPATEECACSYCLEIQVQSTTLVPCGHSFCKECVAACQECPTCRTAVENQIPCRTVDNIIHAMVKSNFFSDDDVQVYEERRLEVVEVPAPLFAHAAANVLSRRAAKRQKRRRGKLDKVLVADGEGASQETAICIDD